MKLSYGPEKENEGSYYGKLQNKKLEKCWCYICLPIQIILMIFIGIIVAIVFISQYTNIDLPISFDVPTTKSISRNIPIANQKELFGDWASAGAADEIVDGVTNEINENSQTNVTKTLFYRYDIDSDLALSKQEFGNLISGTFKPGETFDAMDHNSDGKVLFAELYYLFQVVDSVPSLNTEPVKQMMRDIFGDDLYADFRKPILSTEILTQQMDTSEAGFITKQEYVQYVIDTEWEEYDTDENGLLTLTEFETQFTESTLFTEMKKLREEDSKGELTINRTQVIEQYESKLETAEQ
eukprot:472844_1